MQGLPRISTIRSSSRATRMPEMELSVMRARHSRLKSSTTARMRNLPATSERIGRKVDGPALVRALRGRHWSPCSQRTLAPAAFAHHQPFLAIEPVELLPVQHDALAPEHKVQAPVAEPPSLRSQFLQPLPEPRIVRPLRDIAVGLRRQTDQPARTTLRVVSVFDRPVYGRSPRPGRKSFFRASL